jgi:D-alanyl-lipoteichoic acid acyltransferase DltB (MBOAT superfamily)
MTITSLLFAAFCLVSLVIYWKLPDRFRGHWLFAVSIAFLLTWSWQLLGIFVVIGTVNFFLGKMLAKAHNNKRSLLWIGIGFNVFILVALKYSDFYLQGLFRLVERMGFRIDAGGLNLLVPIGLSFVIVQMISYLADIYKGILAPESRWLNFVLFVIYFPKLLSGPVERARKILPVFKNPACLNSASAERFFWLIIIGLVKKVIFADSLAALIPSEIFLQPDAFPGQDLVVYLLAYAFAIYNDFAGYSNIACGISGLFGIELTGNFKLPYFSRNFTEFWERWHVSFSNWLRDYIYFPVSRALVKRNPNREEWVNIVLPPFVTMFVSSMWHGIGWNFLVWGGLHGTYLVVERVIKIRSPKNLPGEWSKWRQWLSTLSVFAMVVIAWLPFRMDLRTAWQYLLRLPGIFEWTRVFLWFLRQKFIGKLAWNNWYAFQFLNMRVLVLILLAIVLDWVQLRTKDETFITTWPLWAQALFLAVFAIVLVLLSLASNTIPFIYQGF